VDDATGGAQDKGPLKNMEDIIEKDGFCFQESDVSGKLLEKEGELRKVLGLRWGTENNEISIDVKYL
jgi:hypothetical protein